MIPLPERVSLGLKVDLFNLFLQGSLNYPIWGGIKQCKSMVVLKYFPYNSALFWLVSYNDPFPSVRYIQWLHVSMGEVGSFEASPTGLESIYPEVRKPPSLGSQSWTVPDGCLESETFWQLILLIGHPKTVQLSGGRSTFVTLNVPRPHRVNPCFHMSWIAAWRNPMEHTAGKNEFGTQRMVTEVWSWLEWQKEAAAAEISFFGSAKTSKNPTQRRKKHLSGISCGEWMDGVDWCN